jgi:hypothetical protein
MSRSTSPRLPGPPVPPSPRKRPRRRRRLPRWLIGLLVVTAVPVLAVTFGAVLLMLGQTEFLAQLIVGCVLLVVFGTPALCLLGFFIGCFWLMARAGRARRPTQRAQEARPSALERVVVGEVMLDD